MRLGERVLTAGNVKKFSDTDGEFSRTMGIQALKCVSTTGTENDPLVTEILYRFVSTNLSHSGPQLFTATSAIRRILARQLWGGRNLP